MLVVGGTDKHVHPTSPFVWSYLVNLLQRLFSSLIWMERLMTRPSRPDQDDVRQSHDAVLRRQRAVHAPFSPAWNRCVPPTFIRLHELLRLRGPVIQADAHTSTPLAEEALCNCFSRAKSAAQLPQSLDQ